MSQETPPGLAAPRSILEPALARRLLLGLTLIILMVVSVGGWAATTPIGGAVIASGFVVVESNIKKVQHPTGGIVAEINVKNGNVVNAGDVVISLDEKTQIQALSRTQPLLPLRLGLAARQTHDYRRNGLTSLSAALEITSGRVLGECALRHTGADFLRFMRRVVRRYRGRALHVVLDNASTHSTPAVQRWLSEHPEVQFTPKGASWLNMVEAWFGLLTRKSVRRGLFDTVRALIRHIEAYIAEWNGHPTPFV